MRTKTIIVGAAIIAAGALSSMAQSNVFSLNTVGYYTLNLTNKFQMIANQLDADGTGTNNTIAGVLGTNLPNQSKVYIFSGGAFTGTSQYSSGLGVWGNAAAANTVMQPGKGFFLFIPTAAVTPIKLTIVGNVLGTNGVTNHFSTPYATGYNILASQVPVSSGVQTGLGLTPANQDFIYQFNPATQSVGAKHQYSSALNSWGGGGEPVPAVGEAFWYNAKVANSWNQSFIVQ